MSGSVPDSVRPFKALGVGEGEAARVLGASESGLSVLTVLGDAKEGFCSPAEEEGEVAEAVDSLAEGRSLALATVSGIATEAVSGAGKGGSGSTVEEGSVTGAVASSLSTGTSGCTSPGEEDLWTTDSSFGVSSGRRKSADKYLKILKKKHDCVSLLHIN